MSFFRKPTPLPVQQGGTGDAYFSSGYALIGNGYSALLELTPSTSGNVMTSNGTTWTSAPATGVTKDANGNITVNAVYTGFTNVAAAGTTTTLTAASTPNFVVTGSGGQTYQLPDATTLPNGAIFTFNNNQSSGTIVVKNNSGTTIVTVQSGGFFVVVLLSNSIAAGSWDYHAQAPSNVSWSTNTFNYVGSITGATWNGTAIGALYGGTGSTSAFTSNGVAYATSTSALATGSALTFNGTNLGVGTSPSAWGAGTSVIDLNTAGSAAALSSSGTLSIASNGYFNGTNWIYKNSSYAQLYQMISGKHSWQIAPIGTAGNAITFTQAMTLDTSGNLGIGNTSPDAKISLGGSAGYFINLNDGNVIGVVAQTSGDVLYSGTYNAKSYGFLTSNTERMRIDSNGALLINVTGITSSEKFNVNSNGTRTAYITNGHNAASGDLCLTLTLGANANNTNSYLLDAATGGADKMYIYGNGNVVNVNNSYGTLSDVKLKENIVDATPKLEDVLKLKVRNFNLKTDPEHKQIGFIAQEFEEVFPKMVDESFDRDENKNPLETTTKSIKTSVLIPVLVKAIQELTALVTSQSATITSLTERISALENR